ncbi:MAG: DUF3592 domain-containing protein [Elusimicrobia bacterium]|nr:DUF3592 domain-containing protein [Elusimicrobiota bacterium]
MFGKMVILSVIIAGLLLAYLGITRMYRSIASKNWPTTDGTVIRSVLNKHVSHDHSPTGAMRENTGLAPEIVYEYTVSGNKYTNDTFSYKGIRNYRDAYEAQDFIDQYPIGKKVTVHYNPKSPKISTLNTDTPWAIFIVLMVAASLLIGGSLLCLTHAPRS